MAELYWRRSAASPLQRSLEWFDEILIVTRLGRPTIARLHEHHREHDGHGLTHQPQRETLELGVDGGALEAVTFGSQQKCFRKLKACKYNFPCSALLSSLSLRKHQINRMT